MGTNYYARRIPTEEEIKRIKKAIDDNDYDEIKYLVNDIYGRPHPDYTEGGKFKWGEIHLGKISTGWKFLWNPNWYCYPKGHTEAEQISETTTRYHYVVDDKYNAVKIYDLTKESIKALIDREDIVICSEYGDEVDKEEFWNMALTAFPDGYDGDNRPKDEKIQHYIAETDYIVFLKHNGCNFNGQYIDFTSDGLRFATTTDFC